MHKQNFQLLFLLDVGNCQGYNARGSSRYGVIVMKDLVEKRIMSGQMNSNDSKVGLKCESFKIKKSVL